MPELASITTNLWLTTSRLTWLAVSNAFESAIKRLHPYELPEIVAVPVQYGSAEYLEWINSATVTEIG